MKYYRFLPLVLILVLLSCDKNGDDKKTVKEITSEVTSIAVDKNNVKWIGTSEGLYKSLGDEYELQDLSASGRISALYYEKSADILWIGTESMLLKATITDGKITDSAIDNSNLSNPKMLGMYKDSDSKRWIGTAKGFSLNYGDTWKSENFRVNVENTLFAMDIEDFAINSIASWDGDYFFATSGAKLYRAFEYNETVDAFSGATQWDPPYNGLNITDTMFVVFVDDEGKQWMGGKAGIQVHTGHNPKDNTSFTYYNNELPDSYILTISQAVNGDIWVGTRKGIAVFNGSSWSKITNGLPDLYVSAIGFDDDGSKWIGTKKGLANID